MKQSVKTFLDSEADLKNLFPINIEYCFQSKTLLPNLMLFKICRSFPRDQVGEMKQFQLNIEKHNLALYLYKKDFEKLEVFDQKKVIKIAKLRSQTPIKCSNYTRFLCKSLIYTCSDEKLNLSLKSDDSFLIEKDLKITLNKNKTDMIYLDDTDLFDSNDLFKENVAILISQKIKDINWNNEKIIKVNDILNLARLKYINIFNHISNEKEKFKEFNLKKPEKTQIQLVENLE